MLKTKHKLRLGGVKKRGLTALFVLPATLLALTAPAMAQDKTSPDIPATIIAPTDGLTLNLGADTPDFASKRFELPPESVGSTLFKLDIADPSCMTGGEHCLSRNETLDFGYAKAFESVSTSGLDLTLTPRAALRFNDESSSAVVGAVVEIGEDLRKGSNFDNNTWYFFAGADAEALTYSPNSVGRMTSGEFHLQDRIIVGDAQAGLGYRIGDADVSLSYLRREASAEDFSFKEDAAALSFTWKR